MEAKLTTLLEFLNAVWQKRPQQQPKRGKPPLYSAMSFVLFFMLMALKRIYQSGRLHEGLLAISTKLSLGSIIWLTRKSFRRMNRGLSVRVKILTGKIKFGRKR